MQRDRFGEKPQSQTILKDEFVQKTLREVKVQFSNKQIEDIQFDRISAQPSTTTLVSAGQSQMDNIPSKDLSSRGGYTQKT